MKEYSDKTKEFIAFCVEHKFPKERFPLNEYERDMAEKIFKMAYEKKFIVALFAFYIKEGSLDMLMDHFGDMRIDM